MKKLSVLSIAVAAVSLLFSQASLAACDEIVLGAATSLTGKYATNGIHTKNGYEYAIQKIKDAGGVKIGDKCYNFRVIYYDDESKGDRGATLAERLISQDNVTLPAIVWGRWTQGTPTAAAAITVLMMLALVPLLIIAWSFARRSNVAPDAR